MIRALNSAASGMDAQQTQIDIIANNMANVNTTAFKKSRAEFQDLYYQQVRAATEPEGGSAGTPVGLEIGQGVQIMSSQKMFMTGDLIQTGGKLDMAIEGQGFFKVTLPDGSSAYSRNGSFKVDQNGQVVTGDGAILDPQIQIPETAEDIAITAAEHSAKGWQRASQGLSGTSGPVSSTDGEPGSADCESMGRSEDSPLSSGLVGPESSEGSAVDVSVSSDPGLTVDPVHAAELNRRKTMTRPDIA